MHFCSVSNASRSSGCVSRYRFSSRMTKSIAISSHSGVLRSPGLLTMFINGRSSPGNSVPRASAMRRSYAGSLDCCMGVCASASGAHSGSEPCLKLHLSTVVPPFQIGHSARIILCRPGSAGAERDEKRRRRTAPPLRNGALFRFWHRHARLFERDAQEHERQEQ